MSDILLRLEALINSRKAELAANPALADQSYVARLLAQSSLKRAEKLGEEAVETVIAACAQDDEALTQEAADLLFHLLVTLAGRDLPLANVFDTLERREGVSGITEKKRRQT